MNKTVQWALGSFGIAVVGGLLGLGGFALKSYNANLVAQEVSKQTAPMAEQQAHTNQALESILFRQQLADDQEAMEKCQAAGRNDCKEESDWRWDVYFPWTVCAAQYKDPKTREIECGKRPVYERRE